MKAINCSIAENKGFNSKQKEDKDRTINTYLIIFIFSETNNLALKHAKNQGSYF